MNNQQKVNQAKNLSDVVSQLVNSSKFEDAIPKALQVFKLYEDLKLWKEYVEMGKTLGDLYRHIADFKNAKKYLNMSLAKGIMQFGEKATILSPIYNLLGETFYHNSNYSKALIYYQKAIDLYINNKETKHSNIISTYRNIAGCYCELGDFDLAIEYAKKVVQLDLEVGNEHEHLAASYNNLGYIQLQRGEYEESLAFFQKSIVLKQKLLPFNHPDLAITYQGLSNYYEIMGIFDEALQYHEFALNIFIEVFGMEHPKSAFVIRDMSICHWRKGDFKSAIVRYNQSLRILVKNFGEEHIEVASTYMNKAICLNEMGEFDEAEILFEKAHHIFNEKLGVNNYKTVQTYLSKGVLYIDTEKYDKAIELFEEVLPVGVQIWGTHHANIGLIYRNLGVCHNKKGNFDYAIQLHKKNLEIQLKAFGKNHFDVANTYINLGSCHSKQRLYKKAIFYYQQAIICLSFDFELVDIFKNPSIENCMLEVGLIHALFEKGKTLKKYSDYSESTTNFSILIYSLVTLELGIQVFEKIQRSYKSEIDKLTLAKKVKSNIQEAFKLAVFLSKHEKLDKQLGNKYREKAFNIAEKSKAIVLFNTMKDIENKINTNIHTRLLNKEQGINRALTILDKKINHERNKPDRKQNKSLLNDSINAYHNYWNQLELLKKQYEQNTPTYYQLKYNTQLIRIEQIQKNMNAQTALIEYFITPDFIFVFIITNQNCHLEQIEKQPNLVRFVQSFLMDLHTAKENPEDYWRIAYKLHRQLWQPIEKYIPSHIQHLLIIPDEDLSLLPFEALVTNPLPKDMQPQSLQNAHYLIQDYEISYHYSATLWHYIQQKRDAKERTTDNFIGFAPIYRNRNPESLKNKSDWKDENNSKEVVVGGRRYSELRYSEIEVEQVEAAFKAKHLNAKTILHQASTKSRFIQETKAYKHILVSAHHSEELGIAFSPEFTPTKEEFEDELLTLAEAYNLDLKKTDLLVLSCCSSGVGKTVKGEGIMSINRGFLYAGAKNIICTLFKIYEKESAELVRLFYEQALEGKTYSQALRIAKLSMLQRNDSQPVDWAGFVLIGIQ